METVQSRSILIPHMDAVLRVITVAAPPSFRTLEGQDAESALAEAAEFIFGCSPKHVLTYGLWDRINKATQSIFDDPAAKAQLLSSLAGDDRTQIEEFERDFDGARATIGSLGQRIRDQHDFGLCIIRNVLLNGGLRTVPGINSVLSLSGYAQRQSITRSLYKDLSEHDELTLRLWSGMANAALNQGISPSAKGTMGQFLSNQIAFSASPGIKPETLANAVKFSRGCGMFVLGGTAIDVVASLGTHQLCAGWLTLINGAAMGLVFVSFGVALPHVEAAISHGLTKLGAQTKK